MDTKEIQKRIDELMSNMLAKGLKSPVVQFDLESGRAEQRIYLRWDDPTKLNHTSYDGTIVHFIRNKDAKATLDDAAALIDALPSAEETKLKQFMGALANVIELGKSNGIEVEFLNPLAATMKKLSDNILTDQRAA